MSDYTSIEADNLMIESGLKRQKRKALRDKLAAQILLQGYLDAGCPEVEPASRPLADAEDHDRSTPSSSAVDGWAELPDRKLVMELGSGIHVHPGLNHELAGKANGTENRVVSQGGELGDSRLLGRPNRLFGRVSPGGESLAPIPWAYGPDPYRKPRERLP